MNKSADSLINEKLIILNANSNSEEHENSSEIENVSTDKYFHPDRTQNQNSPFVLQEIYKSQGDELFKLILGLKEHLLNKLEKVLELEDHEKYGNELWKITIDYHNASQGQWNKLKVLKKDDIKELSSEVLKQNSMLMGEMAYHQYRAACKFADKAKMLKKQVKLRGHMALFNGGSEEKEICVEGMSSDLNTDIKLENDFNNAMALVRINNQGISPFIRENIQNKINKELITERSLVRYQTSYKEILRTKMHAKLYQAKGCLIMTSGVVAGGAGFTSLLGPVELVAGFGCLVGGAYDDEKYQEFINALSEEYDKNHKPLFYCAIILLVKNTNYWCHTCSFESKRKKIFQLALNDKLVKEARELDECNSKLRKTCRGSCEKYLDDSQEMPFFSRLEEMRNIARINFAILNIIESDEEACKLAKETIKQVRKSVKENFQFVSKAELRLEVLEDFLWIISGEDLSDSNTSFNTFPLKSLNHWQSDQENYNIAHEIDPDNSSHSLGYARCLLKLSKYTQVIKLSDTYPGLNSLPEYWHLRCAAYSKQKKYKDAMTCNTEALNLDPGNIPAGKYRELIKKLNVNNKIEHHIDRYKKELTYKIDFLKNSHSDESPSYKILSIDGGGIRGILPALWLSEIEYRTHRPISHLFNMIAGTSTGGGHCYWIIGTKVQTYF
ncbi:11268_t:CDS:2 [Gigaspora rosea]|nr:11268_t:CDS:2 [Gigaspora rosea]